MMDRRFWLALGLSIVVVVLTSILFPTRTPSKLPGTGPGVSDTAAQGASVGASVGASAGATSATGVSGAAAPGSAAVATAGVPAKGAPIEGGQTKPSASSPSGVAGVATTLPETLTVPTPHTVVAFSNIGAAPVAVTMRDYHATVRNAEDRLKSPLVQLGRPGESLLRYRVIAGSDTMALDRVPFRARRGTASDGAPSIAFDADVPVRDGPARHIEITYNFTPDGYLSRVAGTIDGVPVAAGGTAGAGGSTGYLLIDLPSGFPSYEADTADDVQQLAYVVKPVRDDAASSSFSRLEPGQSELRPGPISWAVAKDKYFLVGVLAPDTARGHQFAELDLVGQPRVGKTATRGAATVVLPLARLAANPSRATFAFDLYTGPQEYRRLRAIGRDFENLTPYGGFLHPILQPFATLVIWTIIGLRRMLQVNYGWVLILFGFITRVVLWPLNQRAMRTSIKMQRVQPELAEVQAKWKSDPQRQQQEIMRVYREHGMTPWSPIAGCLPMLLPWPILAALFFVFRNTIEFRGVSFLWLHDISVKDPYYIMPVLMGLTSFLVSWIGMRNVPPNPQTKMMAYLFPIMMTVFLANLPAGLNLYYFAQNLATLPQQWILSNERARAAIAGGAGSKGGSGGSGGSGGGSGGGGGSASPAVKSRRSGRPSAIG